METTEALEHFGVKGMHWGVRHTKAELESKATEHEKKSVANAQAAEHVKGEINDLRMNGTKSAPFKRVYGEHAHAEGNWEFYGKNGQSHAQALQQTDNNLRLLHNHYVSSANHHSKKAAKLRASAAKLEHGESFDEIADFLEHHGVKGMKWGEHHARRQARADANEFAKARAFYGQGAGTRRKLIKAKVETRMSNPHYKAEFHRTLSGQNLEKRSAQATRLRKRKDTSHFVGKTTRGVHRQLTGGFGPVTATAATIAAGAAYAHKTGLDKAVINKVKSAATNKSAQEATRAWLKSQGIG